MFSVITLAAVKGVASFLCLLLWNEVNTFCSKCFCVFYSKSAFWHSGTLTVQKESNNCSSAPLLLKMCLQITIFWNVTLYSLVDMCQHLGRTCFFHLLPLRWKQQVFPKCWCILHYTASYPTRLSPVYFLLWQLKYHLSSVQFSCVICSSLSFCSFHALWID